MGCYSAGDVQTLGRKSPRQSLSCHKGKGWAHPVLMSTTGKYKYVTGKVGLQFKVGVQILLMCIYAPEIRFCLWKITGEYTSILNSVGGIVDNLLWQDEGETIPCDSQFDSYDDSLINISEDILQRKYLRNIYCQQLIKDDFAGFQLIKKNIVILCS
jgi:hypothetical protein